MNRAICSLGFLVLAAVCAWGQTDQIARTPPVPELKSPVDAFRALLVMPAAERRRFVATRNTNAQERLVQKIREYQSLTPEERELRLKATELRWYLQPLMHSPATNRPAQLALIPESMRGMVASRIEQWDRIPAPVQQMFLTNDQSAGYFARVAVPTKYPALPTAQIRRSLAGHINQLFDLTPGEKEKVLGILSDAERRQMEKTWDSFQELSPLQRRQCLLAFKKFSDMPPVERQEFLKNAERWSQLAPAERQAWRELVSLAPTMPPLPSMRVAPLPISAPPRKPVPATTNGG
jgi:hypothetical protein